MTTGYQYDKRKLIILRAMLIVLDAALGWLALWQYFTYFPDMVKLEYRIVITVVSSTLVALMLWLSAKPLYRLGASIAYSVSAVNSQVGTRGIVAVVLGIVAAGAVVFVFDVVIRKVQDIWAVRLLADVLVYLVVAALCCCGFMRLVNAPHDEKTNIVSPGVGYLLTAECFSDSRVLTAAYMLINVKVCDGIYKALCLFGGEKSAESIRRLDALVTKGFVRVVRSSKSFTDKAEYEQSENAVAENKRLKLITAGSDYGGISLDMFAQPSSDIVDEIMSNRGAETF